MRNILLLVLIFLTLGSVAQRRRSKPTIAAQLPVERVKKVPLDTIATGEKGTFVVIYSNNTWEFHRPQLSDMDNLNIFRHNWDTTSIFSYRNIELKDIPEVVELKLTEDLGDFCSPTVGAVLAKYGPRSRTRRHNGVDIPLKVGEPILATFDGKVRYAKYNTGGFGYLVIIRHKNGLETYSAHLSRLNVKVGDFVKAGQVVGFGGSTGRSRGPHLHFEMRYMDQTFDPEHLIDFSSGSLRYMTFALQKGYFNIHSRASEILEDGDDEMGVSDILAAADDSTAIRAQAAPKPAQSTTGAVYHTVVSGDMLSKLAVKYGVSVDQICRLSGITRTSMLNLKQRLRIK